MSKNTLSTALAAEYMGVTPQTMRRWHADESVPIRATVVNARIWHWRKQDLDALKIWRETHTEAFVPGRKPENPRTKTITLPDGSKKRVDMRYKARRAKLATGEDLAETIANDTDDND